MGIVGVQISADGKWILFVALAVSENQARLQLVRSDGQGLQTLFCASMNEIGSIQWSPDSQHVAFTSLVSGGQDTAIYVLDLATARLAPAILANYTPQSFLPHTPLYLTQRP